jgi:hypothetical protein
MSCSFSLREQGPALSNCIELFIFQESGVTRIITRPYPCNHDNLDLSTSASSQTRMLQHTVTRHFTSCILLPGHQPYSGTPRAGLVLCLDCATQLRMTRQSPCIRLYMSFHDVDCTSSSEISAADDMAVRGCAKRLRQLTCRA